MPSSSPSPTSKRPSMAQRSSSTHSLSSSGKQQTGQQKVHRVSRHSRNLSHGKGLAKLGKINPSATMAADGRNHSRKKSGSNTPAQSPRTPVSPHVKRNSSHVTLPKNASHGNLRKNQSATALATGRTSSTNLKKLGARPSQKQQDEHKQGFFELGDNSSGEDDEGEWEDSTTQSPELSRNHSKASTPLRSRTPNGDVTSRQPTGAEHLTSPPDSGLKTVNRSLPNLRKAILTATEHKPVDPALLHGQQRSSRAPPAMITASAHYKSDESRTSAKVPKEGSARRIAGDSSPGGGIMSTSDSQGVSHFLPSSSAANSERLIHNDSEDEEINEFMANYKPQPPSSTEDSKMPNKARLSSVPSRTQQRLELQRREVMRAEGQAPTAPSTTGMGLSVGSSISLHSKSGSKTRPRPVVGDPKALQHDYEACIKQLTVVRRFRNPLLESLHRLQGNNSLPSEVSSISSGVTKSRPQSRRGPVNANETSKTSGSQSPEDKKGDNRYTASGNRAKPSKVQFQMSRQGSHEDILTASRSSPGDTDEDPDGVSPEEALISRIWESQVSFEPDGAQNLAPQARMYVSRT